MIIHTLLAGIAAACLTPVASSPGRAGDIVPVALAFSDDSLRTRSYDSVGAGLASRGAAGGPDSAALDLKPTPIEFITNLPSDWARWGSELWSDATIPVVLGLTCATTGLMSVDQNTHRLVREPYVDQRSFRRFADAAVFVGDGKAQFGLAAAFTAWGLIANDARALRTGSQTAEVILACGGVVQLIKHLTGRQRPSAATTPTGRWAFLPAPAEYHRHVPRYDAFPSGHLSTATATLQVIIENYPGATWLRWIGYPVLGAVAVGLAASSMHWWSDYPLALALGYSFGRLVGSRPNSTDLTQQGIGNTPERNNGRGQPRLGLCLLPSGNVGLGVSVAW